MPYRFALEDQDYTDFAGGRVLYSLPGRAAFPVRLASEMLRRCLALRAGNGLCTLYDPCCGGAGHLATLTFLHWDQIGAIVASDVDEEALNLTRRNLSLLAPEGLERRMAELEALYRQYGKESHRDALASAFRLKSRLERLHAQHPITVSCFRADATRAEEIQRGLGELDGRIDLLLSDLPYGQLSAWQVEPGSAQPPAWQMLDALRGSLAEGAALAIASDKGQKVQHEGYRQAGKFRVGKRVVTMLLSET
jgi:hypothetical protein